MKKIEILKQVEEVMKNDAACCKDKNDVTLSKYELLIKEDMSDNDFLLTINSYLSTYGLTGHLYFKRQGQKGLPFRVQRYGDILYVTDVSKNSTLRIGDKIVEINGGSIKDFYEKYIENFFKESLERYRITSLLREKDLELGTVKNLIIDVRGNTGGNGFSYYPLLKYCLPKGKQLSDLNLLDDGVLQYGQEILYSERNCDVRIEIIEELLQKNLSTCDEDILKQALNELRYLRGKGFIKQIGISDSDIMGDSDVEHVYILTDSSCCSAGDAFVYLFKQLPKVTVVGRPTQGIEDYSNAAYALFDEYALVYPTSRLLALDYGRRMMGTGVSVDEYIPWKPEHLERDVDLEYTLNLITQKNDKI